MENDTSSLGILSVWSSFSGSMAVCPLLQTCLFLAFSTACDSDKPDHILEHPLFGLPHLQEVTLNNGSDYWANSLTDY